MRSMHIGAAKGEVHKIGTACTRGKSLACHALACTMRARCWRRKQKERARLDLRLGMSQRLRSYQPRRAPTQIRWITSYPYVSSLVPVSSDGWSCYLLLSRRARKPQIPASCRRWHDDPRSAATPTLWGVVASRDIAMTPEKFVHLSQGAGSWRRAAAQQSYGCSSGRERFLGKEA